MTRIFALVTCLTMTSLLGAQTVGGTIQGTVKDETGKALGSLTAIATGTGAGGKTYAATTSATGTFTIPNAQAGTYTICVQEPGGTHLDPCHWGTPPQATVTSGQSAPITITMVKGTKIQVRINDPSQIAAANANNSEVLVGVKLPSGFFQRMRVASNDASGKTYDIAVPLNTGVNLSITSPHLSLTDDKGGLLGASVGTGISSALGAVPVAISALQLSLTPTLTYTVTSHK